MKAIAPLEAPAVSSESIVATPREAQLVKTDPNYQVAVRRLEHEMKKRDWSSSKVAKEINSSDINHWMDRKTSYEIIHYNRYITSEEMEAFAYIFGLTVEEFTDPDFNFEEPDEPVPEPEQPRLRPDQKKRLAYGLFKVTAPRVDTWEGSEEYWMEIVDLLEPDLLSVLEEVKS